VAKKKPAVPQQGKGKLPAHKPKSWEYDHTPDGDEVLGGEPQAGPQATITQKELAEYEKLQSLCRKKEELRLSILARLGAGAEVEQGKLWPCVDAREVKLLSWARLTEVVGEKRAAYIREHLEPTVCQYLTIGEVDPNFPDIVVC
jgi:hypothetical protein